MKALWSLGSVKSPKPSTPNARNAKESDFRLKRGSDRRSSGDVGEEVPELIWNDRSGRLDRAPSHSNSPRSSHNISLRRSKGSDQRLDRWLKSAGAEGSLPDPQPNDVESESTDAPAPTAADGHSTVDGPKSTDDGPKSTDDRPKTTEDGPDQTADRKPPEPTMIFRAASANSSTTKGPRRGSTSWAASALNVGRRNSLGMARQLDLQRSRNRDIVMGTSAKPPEPALKPTPIHKEKLRTLLTRAMLPSALKSESQPKDEPRRHRDRRRSSVQTVDTLVRRSKQYLVKNRRNSIDIQRLLNSNPTKLVALSVETCKTVVRAPHGVKYVPITGLIESTDHELLCLSLWHAAERPPLNGPLIVDDRSTWSIEQMREMSLVALAPLQQHAGPRYQSLLQMPVALCSLAGVTNNISPFGEYIFAADKHSLSHSEGRAVSFMLDAKAFESGSAANPKSVLRYVKRTLFAADELELTALPLSSSPLHPITLPDVARIKAAIPHNAAFYAYCYPASTNTARLAKLKKLPSTVVDLSDPFIQWLAHGAFLYFDWRYDVIAVNALMAAEEMRADDSGTPIALYLSPPSVLPPMAVDPLHEAGRWWPVHSSTLRELGYTLFAWVTPCEFLGDHIFTQSGGFAYLHSSGDCSRSFFFPVAPKRTTATLKGGEQLLLHALRDAPLDKAVEVIEIIGAEMESSPILPMPYSAPLHIEALAQIHSNRPEVARQLSDPPAERKLHKFGSFGGDLQVASTRLVSQMAEGSVRPQWPGLSALSGLVVSASLEDRAAMVLQRASRQRASSRASRLEEDELAGEADDDLTPLPVSRRHSGEAPVPTNALNEHVSTLASPLAAPLSAARAASRPSCSRANSEASLLTTSDATTPSNPTERLQYVIEAQHSALGLARVLGFGSDQELLAGCGTSAAEAVEAIRREVLAAVEAGIGDQSDRDNVEYVLDQPAVEAYVRSNDGSGRKVLRDRANNGKTLEAFGREQQARVAELTLGEVAALRLYTTSTYRLVNGPLRRWQQPHPLAITCYLISSAIKKLRAEHLVHTSGRFKPTCLWRGLKDATITREFLLHGGCEVACMSTSSDIGVVALYADSHAPTLLRIKVDTAMDLGAHVGWLSVFPHEQEHIYPPCTFLKPLYTQKIRGLEHGTVVTVRPSFPT